MKRILLLVLFAILLIFPMRRVMAEDAKDLSKSYTDLVEQEKELRAKIGELGQQKTTLKSQINYLDSSITLTQLEVSKLSMELSSKENDLVALGTDIDTLNTRLSRLNGAVDYQSSIFKSRALASYKAANRMPLEIFLSAKSSSEVISYKHYLEKFEEQDRNLLTEMKDLASVYEEHRSLLEKKRAQVAQIKDEIEENKSLQESKQQSLSGQKTAKNDLLAITMNDEVKYQQELADILAEQEAIARAIAEFSSGNLPEGTDVSQGAVVGIQGCTGNCTGDHVHFGVYIPCDDGGWCHTNPESYAGRNGVDWPLADFDITQEYGATDFARNSGFYANKFHNGLDIAGPIGSPVLAPISGSLSYSTDSRGGKGAIIYGEDLMVLMWHLR